MTKAEIIYGFLTYAAAIEKIAQQEAENLLLTEFSDEIQESILINQAFLTYTQVLFDENLLFANDKGRILPTIKGWRRITPKIVKKPVIKLEPKSVEKMTDEEMVFTFVETGFAICHRLPSSRLMQAKAKTAYTDVAEVIDCVANTFNNIFSPVAELVIEPVTEPVTDVTNDVDEMVDEVSQVESKPVKTSKKYKQAKEVAV